MTQQEKQNLIKEIAGSVKGEMATFLVDARNSAVYSGKAVKEFYNHSSLETKEHFKLMEEKISNVIEEMQDIKGDMSEMKEKIMSRNEMKALLLELKSDIKKEADETYTSKVEFSNVKTLVYGGVGLALTAMGGAIINLIIK